MFVPDSMPVSHMRFPEGQLDGNDSTLFEFGGAAPYKDGMILDLLENRVVTDQRENSVVYLIRDNHNQREIPLPLSILRNVVALMKNSCTLEYRPLSVADLTRNVRICTSHGVVHKMPLALIWEASATFRRLFSDSKWNIDEKTGDLELQTDKEWLFDATLLPKLFDPKGTSFSELDLTKLSELWQQAHYLHAPKVTREITEAIKEKIRNFPTKSLENKTELEELVPISTQASQLKNAEIREELDSLIQRWFDEASETVEELSKDATKQDRFKGALNSIKSTGLKEELTSQIAQVFQKHSQALGETNTRYSDTLSDIVQKLSPVTLRHSLWTEEINLLSGVTGLDSLILQKVENSSLKTLKTLSKKINHLSIKSFSGDLSDEDLQDIYSLTKLELLNLSGQHITKARLKGIKKLKDIKILSLRETNLTNPSLTVVSDLKGLRELDVAACKITDAGLALLKDLSKLQKLTLSHNTTFTGAGLKNITCLAHLRELNLRKCTVSHESIVDFLKNSNSLRLKDEGTFSLTYPDGGKYEGGIVNGKQTGKGTITFPNGSKYEGDFVDGKRTGKGTITFPNGDKYEGDVLDGNPHGKGTVTRTNGSKYEGEFVDGKRIDKGTYTLSDGRKGSLVNFLLN